MAPCGPRAAAAAVDRTSGVGVAGDRTSGVGVAGDRTRGLDGRRASGVRTLGSVVHRAGVVWSRRTVHFGAVSPRP